MSPKLKKILQYSFFLGIGIGLMVWQYQKMTSDEKEKFSQAVQSASFVYLAPVILMALLSHFSRAIRWRYLIHPMGYTTKLSNTFATVMIGYLVNTLLPRAGEVVKCTMLGRREKIPPEKLVGTIIVERAIDLLCYLVLILITVVLQFNRIKDFVVEKYNKSLENSTIHPALKTGILIAVVVAIIYLIKWLYKKYSTNPIFSKLHTTLNGLKEGVQSIQKLERKKEFWLHTLLIWSMYLLQIYIGFSAMTFTKGMGIDTATAILTMGTLAMILTPGGVGVFPVAVGEVLVLYGTAEPEGLAFGWVIWGVSTSIIIVFGILCTIWFLRQKKTLEDAVQ